MFAQIILLLLPVIIIESIAGRYLDYRLFLRLRKDLLRASIEDKTAYMGLLGLWTPIIGEKEK